MTSPLSGSIADAIYKGMKNLFLDATLTRDFAGSTSPAAADYDPATPTQSTYSCKAIRDFYSVGTVAGGYVNINDVKIVILQKSLSVTPQPGDRIAITEYGKTYQIVPNAAGQQAVTADPANAIWECRASA